MFSAFTVNLRMQEAQSSSVPAARISNAFKS
jgi:hypothetical protein